MCSEAAGPDLSEAVALFLKRYPGKNDDEFRSRVTDPALQEAVRSLLDETMTIQVDWDVRTTLPDIGDEVRDVVRQRHPDLSDAAVDNLASYFTYLVK
ncbi:hypothetical protein DX116_00880 [Aeromicrobium endophyticum]|uniref:Uncharacterized protein n=2 Tax=Aeromicrobium endophyticum TaxID=2292704 RepID=A0A371PDB6_9ACTN|nr:hypothetical protein DX116_00880 [Aeromicrobium endophyticum]